MNLLLIKCFINIVGVYEEGSWVSRSVWPLKIMGGFAVGHHALDVIQEKGAGKTK